MVVILTHFHGPFVPCSCEVIRDWKTGDSLCYAFIEYEKVGPLPPVPALFSGLLRKADSHKLVGFSSLFFFKI